MKSPRNLMLLIAIALPTLHGCGSQKMQILSTQPVSLSISPYEATVAQGAAQEFSVFITGTSNTAVTWSVVEGATGGSVTASGIYTAPNGPGTYHVTATSQADATVVATATVTVPAVSISVAPTASEVNPTGTRLFSADVEGTINKTVMWALQEGPAAGTISSGLYTAPATLGTFHVVATSAADPSKSAVASIVVTNTAGSFSSVQNMIKVSGVHTATLLPSGQVLVAGGCGGQDFFEVGQPDAELYDPATTSFAVTGSMESPRCRHTATLLPNGKVLVVGGFGAAYDGPAAATNSTELYDSATRAFSQTANMAQARAAHTATLLLNGKVLITGGANIGGWGFPFYGSAMAAAEIYDPATNTFTATGSMGTARFGHTATLLPSGKVLIAGGFTSAEVNQEAASLASAEVYDPVTGTFSPAGEMTVTRGGHTATLLQDGRVLITGGYAAAGPSTTVASSAELYQPSTGVFASAGKMTASREEHTATLLTNGQVLIAGGATATEVLATTELYDPAMGMFAGTDSMATPRTGHSATVLQDGTILVSGGDQSDGSAIPVYLSSAEIYMTPR
jgi:N-acetylneuraminic acid mutarotase